MKNFKQIYEGEWRQGINQGIIVFLASSGDTDGGQKCVKVTFYIQ